MSIAATLSRLRELALLYPRPGCEWEKRPEFGPPAPPELITQFERFAGFVFPADFREFLELTEWIQAVDLYLWLGRINQLIRMIEREPMPRAVEGLAAITIGTDGNGNAFVLSSDGRIWNWDHETGNVNVFAASFAAFLDQIAFEWSNG